MWRWEGVRQTERERDWHDKQRELIEYLEIQVSHLLSLLRWIPPASKARHSVLPPLSVTGDKHSGSDEEEEGGRRNKEKRDKNKQNRMGGGTREDNFLQQMGRGSRRMWQQGQVDAVCGWQVCLFVYMRLFLSHHLVELFSLCLSSTCRTRSQSRRRKRALTNDRVSGLSLLGERSVSRCASLHWWPHQTGQTTAKWLSSERVRTLTFHETLCAKTRRFWVWLPGEIKFLCYFDWLCPC